MKIIGRTGSVAGRDAIVGDTMRIGASADNDFRVEVTGISRHHARIVRDGDNFWLEDTGSTNGTFVNGLRIARERLRHLDVVTLGRGVDLIAVASDQEASKTVLHAVRAAWLEPIDVQGGTRIDIPPGELTLGRSAPSNFLLDSPLVSHLHARLERTPDHLVVSDLASSNGTFVNGQLIREPVELVDGDTLSIAGSRQFRVCIDGTTRHRAPMAEGVRTTVDSEWKTRLVWSADELVELEADRQRILAAWKKEQANAAAAAQQPADQKGPPAAAKAAPPPPKAAAPPPAKADAPAPKAAPPAPKAVAPAPKAAPPAPKPSPLAPKAAAPEPKVAPPAPKAVAPAPPSQPARPDGPKGTTDRPPVATPPAEKKDAPQAGPAAPVPSKPAAPVERPAAPVPRTGPIRSVSLTGPGGSFKLGPGRHEVGRSDSIAMTLLSRQVSRLHAAIVVTPTDVQIEDAKSANGTSINGTKLPVGGSATVQSGDKVAFGDMEFTVEVS